MTADASSVFHAIVRARRMVRNYLDEPVDPAAIDRILDSARRGPSAGFSQGIAFVVATDPATRTSIAELADEPAYVAAGFDPWISRAPVHIVICVSEAVYRARYAEPDKSPDGTIHEWPVPYWHVDGGAALMTILLGAVAENLAAGFLGSHAFGDIAALLEIPAGMTPIGVVTLGHPAADRRSGSLARGRRPVEDVVHHERWGGLRES